MKSKVWLFLLTGFIAFCSLCQARQTKHRLMGALPNWPHRYAPAVIQGCVHGVSQGQYVLAVMSGSSNIKNDPFPEIKDSCGFFSMKYDLAYPTQVNFSVVDHNFMIPLCPGDTVTIDYDLHQVATSQYDAAENQEKNKALHISGGLSSLLCLDSLLGEVRDETYAFTVDAIEEAHRQSYAEFRQSVWNSHQKRLAHYASLPLSEGEREYCNWLARLPISTNALHSHLSTLSRQILSTRCKWLLPISKWSCATLMPHKCFFHTRYIRPTSVPATNTNPT